MTMMCKGSCGKQYPEEKMEKGKCPGCMTKSADADTADVDTAAVTADELAKSMDKIEALAKAETPESRKQALLQKSLDGTATDEDDATLAALLKGEKPAGETSLSDDLSKALMDGEGDELSKAFDVAPALTEICVIWTKLRLGTDVKVYFATVGQVATSLMSVREARLKVASILGHSSGKGEVPW